MNANKTVIHLPASETTKGFEPASDTELLKMAKDYLEVIWLWKLSKPDATKMLEYALNEIKAAKWPE